MAIRVEVEYVDGGFTTRMLHAGETVEQFERNVGKAIKSVDALKKSNISFLETQRDITVTLGMASQAIAAVRSATTGWAADIIKVNAEFERLTTLMKGMSTASDSLADAKQQVRELRDFAKQTPYSMQGLADVFTKLKSGGLDPLKGSMQGLTNAVASFGGSEETLKRAALAMQQMSGKGVIQMEELRQQLGEAVPRATELMARSMGVTIGELVQALSKGTVDAKTGLALLQGEFERTFGGAAAAQMNTWNGLMQQVTNSFQGLQLRAGEAGFFDAAKDKARDLIDLLNSKPAGDFAEGLGRTLTTAVGIIDRVIRKVAEFKSELTAAAITLGAGLGIRAIVLAFMALSGSIDQAKTHFVALRADLRGTATNFSAVRAEIVATQAAATTMNTLTQSLATGLGSALMAPYNGFAKLLDGLRALPGALLTAVTSVAGFNSAMATLRAGLMVTAATVGTVMTALIGLAPVLFAVGAGISFAIQYFDLFGTKAKDARKEVEELGGAASKTSLKLFMKQIQEEERELAKLEKTRKGVAEVGIYVGSAGSGGEARRRRLAEIDQEIAEKKAQIARERNTLNAAGEGFNQNLAQREADKQLRVFDEMVAAQRRQIDIYGQDMQKAQNDAIDAAAKAGKSIEAIKADYAKRERERQLSIHDLVIAQAQDLYDEKRKTLDKLEGVEKDKAERELQGYNERIQTAKQQREELAKRPIGVPNLPKPIDEDELYKKGTEALQHLKDAIAGVRADLNGANKDVAELMSALQAGKFGPIDNDRVKKLIAELVQAQQEKTKLDELLEGKNKFERDLTSLVQKSAEAKFEAENKHLSDFDKLMVRINTGQYAGIGNGGSPAQRSIMGITTAIQAAGAAAQQAATTIQTTLFGSGLVAAGDGIIQKLEKMSGLVTAIKNGASSIQLPEYNGQTPSILKGAAGAKGDAIAATELSRVAQVFLNAIAGPESGGRYNIRYGGVGSPGKEFDTNGLHPQIYERTSTGQKSSAAGKYQFVYDTWKDLGMANMTMSPENQDRAAWTLARRDYKRNTSGGDLEAELLANGFSAKVIQALGPTWEALTKGAGAAKSRDLFNAGWDKNGDRNTVQRDSDYKPRNKEDDRAPIPDNLSPEKARFMDELRKSRQQTNDKEKDNNLSETYNEITRSIEKANDVAGEFNKREAEIRKQIKTGKLGSDDNPDSERYKKLIEKAKEWDAADKRAHDNQKLRSRLNSAVEKNTNLKEDFDFKEEDIKRRLDAGQSSYKLSESLYRQRFNQIRDEMAGEKLLAQGGNNGWSKEQQTALVNANAETFKRAKNLEVSENLLGEEKKNRDIARSLMTVDEQRQASHDEEIARLRAMVAETAEGSDARAQAEATLQERIRLVRKQTEQQSPLGKQMKEWSDLGNNMEKAMTGWLDSGVDAIATFVTTGKADFKSLFQSIAKDITKMALKWSLSQIFGGGEGGGGLKSLLKGGTGAGGAKGAKVQGAAGAKGGGAKMFGAMHTGGIVGAGFSMSRMVNPAIFGSAPRFHTGGIIGADEVPIIAQRGEGVFTREQMAAMGGASGSNVITIAPAVTVNASGGTPAQNADLAAQTAKAVEGQVRSIVVSELMTQMRPGNMLSR